MSNRVLVLQGTGGVGCSSATGKERRPKTYLFLICNLLDFDSSRLLHQDFFVLDYIYILSKDQFVLLESGLKKTVIGAFI